MYLNQLSINYQLIEFAIEFHLPESVRIFNSNLPFKIVIYLSQNYSKI